MGDFKVISTQEEFDAAIKDRLKREKESLENKFSDYDEIKEKNTSLETEMAALKSTMEETTKASQSYENSISELNAKISGYETSSLKTKIALQHGIPYDLAGRLVGEDETSITEDAKKLAEMVKGIDPIPPLKNVEPKDIKDDGYKSLLQNLNLEGE